MASTAAVGSDAGRPLNEEDIVEFNRLAAEVRRLAEQLDELQTQLWRILHRLHREWREGR